MPARRGPGRTLAGQTTVRSPVILVTGDATQAAGEEPDP
jgi:hypothetical protein